MLVLSVIMYLNFLMPSDIVKKCLFGFSTVCLRSTSSKYIWTAIHILCATEIYCRIFGNENEVCSSYSFLQGQTK